MKTKKALSGNGAATRRRNVTPKAEKPKAKAKAKRTRKPKGLTPDELKEMAEINARLQADSKGMRLFNAIPKETESGAIHAETRKARATIDYHFPEAMPSNNTGRSDKQNCKRKRWHTEPANDPRQHNDSLCTW